MKKITKLIEQVADLKGFYVQECEDNFNLGRNYMLGRNGNNYVEYFKTIEDIEYYLGIKEEISVEMAGKEYIKEIKHSFNEIKKKYEKELGY
ncbi:hypothetical protein CLOHAE12215_01321 [Clostridium haemolyticum]|uniref:hypothetical protein n=1 Tax=Clostridium haemolyticum TaxID=84025 RepID=UPI001C3AEEE5|nr:hypothetical protein [Clostridium haemolyticum]CAG7839905.1 hypothetical protein CLOHAE12215_01321 [Clostridium haemolyticum]